MNARVEINERITMLENCVFELLQYILRCTGNWPEHCGEDACLKEMGRMQCPFRQGGGVQIFETWYRNDHNL